MEKSNMAIQIFLQHPTDSTKKRRIGEIVCDRATCTLEVKRWNTLILRNVYCPSHLKKGSCPTLSITESCIIDAKEKGATRIKFYVDFGEKGKKNYMVSIDHMLQGTDGKDDWELDQKQLPIHDMVEIS